MLEERLVDAFHFEGDLTGRELRLKPGYDQVVHLTKMPIICEEDRTEKVKLDYGGWPWSPPPRTIRKRQLYVEGKYRGAGCFNVVASAEPVPLPQHPNKTQLSRLITSISTFTIWRP